MDNLMKMRTLSPVFLPTPQDLKAAMVHLNEVDAVGDINKFKASRGKMSQFLNLIYIHHVDNHFLPFTKYRRYIFFILFIILFTIFTRHFLFAFQLSNYFQSKTTIIFLKRVLFNVYTCSRYLKKQY